VLVVKEQKAEEVHRELESRGTGGRGGEGRKEGRQRIPPCSNSASSSRLFSLSFIERRGGGRRGKKARDDVTTG
jgi:hypothetical protein